MTSSSPSPTLRLGQSKMNSKTSGGKPTGYANRIGRSDLDEEQNKCLITEAMESAKERTSEQKQRYSQENATNHDIWKDGLSGGDYPRSQDLEPCSKSPDHTHVKRMPSVSTTYCSQPEVHNDIYKKMPINSIESINRSQFPEKDEMESQSSVPIMHLLPQRNGSSPRSPKTLTIKEEILAQQPAPKSESQKLSTPAVSPAPKLNQTTQTLLTFPVTPLTLDETSIHELSKMPKVTVDKAPLGVPTQLPVQPKALGSPISPRQSSRKFSRSPKSLKSPKIGKSKPCSPLSGKFILEEEDGDCSMEGEPQKTEEHIKVPKAKIVWTNKHYND